MGKTLGYRLFGWGKLPAPARLQLEQEHFEFLQEGIPVRIGFDNFRAPGRYYHGKRTWGSGSLILTRKQLAGFFYSRKIIDVRLDDPRLKQIRWTTESNGWLCASLDAAAFSDEQSGTISACFKVEEGWELMRRLDRLKNGGFDADFG